MIANIVPVAPPFAEYLEKQAAEKSKLWVEEVTNDTTDDDGKVVFAHYKTWASIYEAPVLAKRPDKRSQSRLQTLVNQKQQAVDTLTTGIAEKFYLMTLDISCHVLQALERKVPPESVSCVNLIRALVLTHRFEAPSTALKTKHLRNVICRKFVNLMEVKLKDDSLGELQSSIRKELLDLDDFLELLFEKEWDVWVANAIVGVVAKEKGTSAVEEAKREMPTNEGPVVVADEEKQEETTQEVGEKVEGDKISETVKDDTAEGKEEAVAKEEAAATGEEEGDASELQEQQLGDVDDKHDLEEQQLHDVNLDSHDNEEEKKEEEEVVKQQAPLSPTSAAASASEIVLQLTGLMPPETLVLDDDDDDRETGEKFIASIKSMVRSDCLVIHRVIGRGIDDMLVGFARLKFAPTMTNSPLPMEQELVILADTMRAALEDYIRHNVATFIDMLGNIMTIKK